MVEKSIKHPQVFLLSIVAGSLTLFGALAFAIKNGMMANFDHTILTAVHTLSSPALDQLVPSVTTLGDVIFVCVVVLIAGIWLASMRRWTQLTILGIGVLGSSAISYLLKALVERARPDLWVHLVTETSHSFPSGHATASAALAACLVVVAWNTKWRKWAIALAICYIAVIAFTRLYAGVHYPSDILAGWLTSIGWVSAVTALAIRTRKT